MDKDGHLKTYVVTLGKVNTLTGLPEWAHGFGFDVNPEVLGSIHHTSYRLIGFLGCLMCRE